MLSRVHGCVGRFAGGSGVLTYVRGPRMRWMEGAYGRVQSVADVDRDELHAVVKQKVGERRVSDAAARLRALVIT